jgi:hypothetical protein
MEGIAVISLSVVDGELDAVVAIEDVHVTVGRVDVDVIIPVEAAAFLVHHVTTAKGSYHTKDPFEKPLNRHGGFGVSGGVAEAGSNNLVDPICCE